MSEVKIFAPASIGNVGPGFDVLGLAITNLGDTVHARKKSGSGVSVLKITGDEGRLSLETEENTASIAAMKVIERIGVKQGLNMEIHKGIPFPCGLGSSAASAVAGGVAANCLFGEKLDKAELLVLCTEAEAEVSGGFFADNTAASLYGGIVLTRRNGGIVDATPLGGMPGAVIIVAQPDFPMPTKESRGVIPEKIRLEDFVANVSASASIAVAACKKDVALLGRSIVDRVIEPVRAALIPGFDDVKRAALEKGALGCSISGGGASVFAVADKNAPVEKIGEAMKKAFKENGREARVHICSVDTKGARRIR